MAIDKLDLVFKKLISREYTSGNKKWFEEYPFNTLSLHTDDIFAEEIPEDPPETSTDIIEVLDKHVLTINNTVTNNLVWQVHETPGDLSSNRYTKFIEPKYGQKYTVRIFDNNDNEIPTTDLSDWIFLYGPGILVFSHNPEEYGWTLPLKISGYFYKGKTLTEILAELRNSSTGDTGDTTTTMHMEYLVVDLLMDLII